jgi:hypothetical protein
MYAILASLLEIVVTPEEDDSLILLDDHPVQLYDKASNLSSLVRIAGRNLADSFALARTGNGRPCG